MHHKGDQLPHNRPTVYAKIANLNLLTLNKLLGLNAQFGHFHYLSTQLSQLKFIENGSQMAKRIQNTVHKNKSNDKCE